jgi:hypothetical protein
MYRTESNATRPGSYQQPGNSFGSAYSHTWGIDRMRPDYDTTLSSEADEASSPLLPLSSSSSHAKRLNFRDGTLSVHSDGEHYSYAYSYGPKGLAGLRANTYALRCAVFASLGGLTFGYDQGVIANVLVMEDFVARWPVGPWELGLMGAFRSFGKRMGECSYLHGFLTEYCSGGARAGVSVWCAWRGCAG